MTDKNLLDGNNLIDEDSVGAGMGIDYLDLINQLLSEEEVYNGMVVDTNDGHLVVIDLYLSKGVGINTEKNISHIVVLQVIDDNGNIEYMSLADFNERRIDNRKICDTCGSKRIMSYDRIHNNVGSEITGKAECNDCGRVYTGSPFWKFW